MGSSKKSELVFPVSSTELSDTIFSIGTVRILVIASLSVCRIEGMMKKPKRMLKPTPIEIVFMELLFANLVVRIGISSMW
ncbi:unannotated protein [freshwater metagenome]|uniref:Unannotated protein n=1 Tax=freshwater metagenome TaxID=449393 RepID=A0A6J7GCU8_9ZZZZ